MIRVTTIASNGKAIKSEVCRDGDHATRYINRKKGLLKPGSSVTFKREEVKGFAS